MTHLKVNTLKEIRRNKLIIVVTIDGDKIVNYIKDKKRTKGKRVTCYRLFLTLRK